MFGGVGLYPMLIWLVHLNVKLWKLKANVHKSEDLGMKSWDMVSHICYGKSKHNVTDNIFSRHNVMYNIYSNHIVTCSILHSDRDVIKWCRLKFEEKIFNLSGLIYCLTLRKYLCKNNLAQRVVKPWKKYIST